MAQFRFPEAKRQEFLQFVRDGMRRGAAADALGLNRRKVREYIAEHPDFETAVLDAEVDATEHVEEALYQAAISGNVSASKIWLEMTGRMRPSQAIPGAPSAPPPPRREEDFEDLYNVEPLAPRRRNRGA